MLFSLQIWRAVLDVCIYCFACAADSVGIVELCLQISVTLKVLNIIRESICSKSYLLGCGDIVVAFMSTRRSAEFGVQFFWQYVLSSEVERHHLMDMPDIDWWSSFWRCKESHRGKAQSICQGTRGALWRWTATFKRGGISTSGPEISRSLAATVKKTLKKPSSDHERSSYYCHLVSRRSGHFMW